MDQLKIKVDESGNIVNIEELISIIKELEMTDNIEEYLNTLNNHIKNSNIKNKDVLSNAIESSLLDYSASKNVNQVSNFESLKMMQEVNEDLKKLGIITTKKENNDSNKNIDYLTYTNEDGVVEVLVCAGDNTLNEYIKNNAARITTMSAKDIFHHFKEYIHVDLQFSDASIRDDNNKSEEQVKEDEIQKEEYEEVKRYADKFSIGGKIEVSLDPNGERLYRVKDGLFKFKTENGMRNMIILQTPSVNLDNTQSLLDELDQEENIYSSVAINENQDKETDKDAITYESLEDIELSSENIEKVMESIQRKDIYGVELTSEELILIDRIMKKLIETMVDRAKAGNREYDALLDDYLGKLVVKYDDVDDKENGRDSLSDLEIAFVENYQKNKTYIRENNLAKTNVKKLELLANKKGNPAQSGIATVVLLLEIMMLALFMLLFSHIDI